MEGKSQAPPVSASHVEKCHFPSPVLAGGNKWPETPGLPPVSHLHTHQPGRSSERPGASSYAVGQLFGFFFFGGEGVLLSTWFSLFLGWALFISLFREENGVSGIFACK